MTRKTWLVSIDSEMHVILVKLSNEICSSISQTLAEGCKILNIFLLDLLSAVHSLVFFLVPVLFDHNSENIMLI